MSKPEFNYSERYSDDKYTYRHIIVSGEARRRLPLKRFGGGINLMTEDELVKFGIRQSSGWTHYASHKPEPWVLLFRRPREKQ